MTRLKFSSFALLFFASCFLPGVNLCENSAPVRCDGNVLVFCQDGIEFQQNCGNDFCDQTLGICSACGNGTLENDEECDDNNNVDADGCEADCTLPACGNGIVDPGEICFAPPQTVSAADGPFSIATDDLNGDSIVDLVTANFNSDNVSVLLGVDDGTFFSAQTFLAGSIPVQVAIEDLNADSIPDIVTSNGFSNDVSILLGVGNGSFLTQQVFQVGEEPTFVTTGDLNRDGVFDLVVTNQFSNDVSVLLGVGNGSFLTQQVFRSEDAESPVSVVIADFNQDTIPDIVTANRDSNNVSVFFGTGNDALFDDQLQAVFRVGDSPSFIAAKDLNQDSILDIVTANFISDNVSVLLGVDGNTFLPQFTLAVGDGPQFITIEDINNDSIPDLLTANELSDNISVLLGAGGGSFLPQLPFSVGDSPISLAIEDLNGDGSLDIATADFRSDAVSILLFEP